MAWNLGGRSLLEALDESLDVISHARPPVAILKERECLCGPQVASTQRGMCGFNEWGSMTSGNICAPRRSRVGVE